MVENSATAILQNNESPNSDMNYYSAANASPSGITVDARTRAEALTHHPRHPVDSFGTDVHTSEASPGAGREWVSE